MRLVVLLVVLAAGTLHANAPAVPVPVNCAAGSDIAQRTTPGTSVGWTRPGQRPQGHAHNDYEHGDPLLDALDAGLSSVEVDVWAVDGELLVAHTRGRVSSSLTLASLYLAPLGERYGGAGDRGSSGVQLLIDIKSPASTTLPLLRAQLAEYAPMLTRYRGCTARPGPVNVVVSGSDVRPTAPTPGTVSYFGYDLQPERTPDTGLREAVTPLISAQWETYFTWNGQDRMPGVERARLEAMVRAAHDVGSAVRFYDTPDGRGAARDALWRELVAAGVDYISTDDLAGFAAFNRRHRSAEPRVAGRA